MPTKGRVTATVQMTPGRDDDLIRWFRKLPKGERNEALKNVLRLGLGKSAVDYHPSNAAAPDGLPDRLAALEEELQRQAQWIEYLNNQLEGRASVENVSQ